MFQHTFGVVDEVIVYTHEIISIFFYFLLSVYTIIEGILKPTVWKEKPKKRKRTATTPLTITKTKTSVSFQRSFIQTEIYTFQIQNEVTSFEVEFESSAKYKHYKRYMYSTSEVQILCKLGQGAYNCVYKSCRTSDGTIVAIKITEEDQCIPSTTLRQLTFVKALNHPNIVKYFFQFMLLKEKYLIDGPNPRVELQFQFMDQDLARFIRKKKTKSLDCESKQYTLQGIMKQIFQGVHYMHKRKVFHRDLKPHKILINQKLQIKIADFGLGRIVGSKLETMSKEIQTLWYRAPELLLGTVNYDMYVDFWSLGCILYQLPEGKVLFQSESELGQIMQIMKLQGTPERE